MRHADLFSLDARLRRLLGLSPALVAAACHPAPGDALPPSPDELVADTDADAIDDGERQATFLVEQLARASSSGATEVEGTVMIDVGGPVKTDRMTITVDGDEWVAKNVQRVRVSGAPPDTLVSLVGGVPGETTCFAGNWCFDLANPTVLDQAYTNLDGEVEFRFLTPLLAALAEVDNLGVQAVAHTPRARISPTKRRPLVDPYTDEWTIRVLHPHLALDQIELLTRYRACVPMPAHGECTELDHFDEWDAREVASYALDKVPDPAWAVGACEADDAHPVDCCYIVELFETEPGQTEAPAELCTEDTDWSDWGAGRPFVVQAGRDDAAPAPVARTAGWQPRADWTQPLELTPPPDAAARDAVLTSWRALAQAEHASVASFSRFNLELLALGAPAELVASSTSALADEIRHAQLAFSVVSELSGRPEGPGPLAIGEALARSDDPRSVLVAAIVEGCIHETISAVQLQRVLPRVQDPTLATRLAEVVDDELRHAELSWSFVRWMLTAHPELVADARAAFQSFRLGPAPAAGPHDDVLATYGAVADSEAHATAIEVLRGVVLPCARDLLATAERGLAQA